MPPRLPRVHSKENVNEPPQTNPVPRLCVRPQASRRVPRVGAQRPGGPGRHPQAHDTLGHPPVPDAGTVLALNKVWRRHRLAQHGFDPNLVDEINRKKNAHIHDAYTAKYGPRPEEARWQKNSSPF